jgi:hypothetical protein
MDDPFIFLVSIRASKHTLQPIYPLLNRAPPVVPIGCILISIGPEAGALTISYTGCTTEINIIVEH